MTSGSSYSFALKKNPPPFNFQNQAPNYAPPSLASASQFKTVVFPPNYQQQASNNYNKYTSSFNSQPQFNSANSNGSPASYSSSFYSPNAQQSSVYNQQPSTYLRNNNNYLDHNNNNIYNGNNLHTGFPPNTFQVNYGGQSSSDTQASSSNNVNTYASAAFGSNQYSNLNNSQQQDTNTYSTNNQRNSENSSPKNSLSK